MKILSLDLGTTTGWATRYDGKLCAGSWELATEKELKSQREIRGDRRLDMRIPALWQKLIEAERVFLRFDYFVFEDVRFMKSTAQGQLWPSFRTTVWLYAHMKRARTECLDTGKLKLWATGNGGSTKEMMAVWLAKKIPSEVRFYDRALRLVDTDTILDDNAVDATHLLLWAEHTLKNG
jgi:hypothetical protein